MSTRSSVPFGRAALLAAMVATGLAVSAAWAQKAAEKASEDRQAFRKSVVAIKGQVDTTLKALNGVVAAQDDKTRQSAFKKYGDSLKAMDSQIQKTRDYAKQMQERGQEYFKEWDKQMAGVSNEALKASATERKATLQTQYEKIKTSMEEAKQDGGKFMKDLQDLQKFYANDLSAESVASTSALVTSTTEDGKKVQGYIDQILAAVDQVGKKVEQPPTAAAPAAGTAVAPAGEAAPPTEPAPEGDKAPGA